MFLIILNVYNSSIKCGATSSLLVLICTGNIHAKGIANVPQLKKEMRIATVWKRTISLPHTLGSENSLNPIF